VTKAYQYMDSSEQIGKIVLTVAASEQARELHQGKLILIADLLLLVASGWATFRHFTRNRAVLLLGAAPSFLMPRPRSFSPKCWTKSRLWVHAL
jgi:hypothetical protein